MLTRLANAGAGHPKRILLLALLFTLVAGAVGGPVAGLLSSTGDFDDPGSQSVAAQHQIERATGGQASPGVIAVVATPAGATSPAGRIATARIAATLRRDPSVASVVSLRLTGDKRFVARDGTSTFVAATLKAGADGQATARRLETAFAGRSDVRLGGAAIAGKQSSEQITSDLGRAELLALPLLLVLSLLFFRNGRAAAMTLALGMMAILGTFLAMLGINEIHGLSIFALNLVIGLGLGLSVDYSLFMVNRYREELDARGPGREAIVATMRSAGRTIAFSSLTVAAALISLVVFPLNFLQSMGIGGATVALVSAAVALTVTPAFFALWGEKLQPRSRRSRAADAGAVDAQGRWYRLSRAVMRRPGLVAAVTGALMVALAFPALRAEWTGVDATVLPTSQSARVVADTLQRDYPDAEATPTSVVVSAPRSDGAKVAAYANGLSAIPGVTRVEGPRSLDADTWEIPVTADGRAVLPRAQDVVREIRSAGAPFPVAVGGSAAQFTDQQAGITAGLAPAILLLAGSTLVILWLMTGSIILPVKALIMNALTVGAALGLLTLVFQDGRLEGLLAFTSQGGIESTDFLVVAVLVFGLSTDYGVFLLARIKEARDGGLPDREAVAVGIERTGAIVTAAAILLAVAIGAFVTSEVVFIKQIGFGVAAGVLIDAFVVRALLVPSLMALLGRWNWWAPTPLRLLHRRIGIAHEGGEPMVATR